MTTINLKDFYLFLGNKNTAIYLSKLRYWMRQLAAGGDEESRTPVRKPLTKAFYECSHLIKIPSAPRQMAGSALQ